MAKEFVTSSALIGNTHIRVHTPEKRINTLQVTSCSKVVKDIEKSLSYRHGFSNEEIEDIKAYCSNMHYWCEIRPGIITIIKAKRTILLKKIGEKWMAKEDIKHMRNVKEVIESSIKSIKNGKEGNPLFKDEEYTLSLSRNDKPIKV